jgi:hypothetical protein
MGDGDVSEQILRYLALSGARIQIKTGSGSCEGRMSYPGAASRVRYRFAGKDRRSMRLNSEYLSTTIKEH